MALYDNKYWLLSHIRNSFISTDDTGMCELIMTGEEGVRKYLKQRLDPYPDDEDSEDEDDLSHESYDLQLDTDFPIRYRSNIAVQLEKLEQERKRTSKMKHVKWESSPAALSQDQILDLFEKKEVKPKENKQSLFSKNFKQYGVMPSNPFIQYAKFDGTGHINVQTKKYRIFLTMLPEQQKNYPIHICCTINAKILDLIGLILLKSSTKHEDYNWKPLHNYGLYITEEDGEVDRDFPCLDSRENIAKFGFSCLGLVEHSDPNKCVSFSHSDSISISKSEHDKRSKESSKSDQEKQISSDLHLMDVHKKSMEAPLYTSYNVYMLTKMRSKVEIHLGISGEKIEIDPVQKNTKFNFVKQKPINHDMDTIAWCETVEVKSNKTIFRIYYSHYGGNNQEAAPSSPTLHTSASFKSYDFEADHSTAQEIVHKISLILELRSGDTRKEYLAAQERKFYKKKGLI